MSTNIPHKDNDNDKGKHSLGVSSLASSSADETIATLSFTPRSIPHNYMTLRRMGVQFIEHENIMPFLRQPFVVWSNDKLSVEFMKEYYKYVCNPLDHSYSYIKDRNKIVEREYLTQAWADHLSGKIGAKFESLAVYPFFEKVDKDLYQPTHDLICHMLCMSAASELPPYMSSAHLGDPKKSKAQLDYYTKFLMEGGEWESIIPNRPWLVRILQEFIKIISQKNQRLIDVEIDVKEIAEAFKAAKTWPFEIYESLLRDQLRLVDYISDEGKIGFKLTDTGAKFLFLCCPREF